MSICHVFNERLRRQGVHGCYSPAGHIKDKFVLHTDATPENPEPTRLVGHEVPGSSPNLKVSPFINYVWVMDGSNKVPLTVSAMISYDPAGAQEYGALRFLRYDDYLCTRDFSKLLMHPETPAISTGVSKYGQQFDDGIMGKFIGACYVAEVEQVFIVYTIYVADSTLMNGQQAQHFDRFARLLTPCECHEMKIASLPFGTANMVGRNLVSAEADFFRESFQVLAPACIWTTTAKRALLCSHVSTCVSRPLRDSCVLLSICL